MKLTTDLRPPTSGLRFLLSAFCFLLCLCHVSRFRFEASGFRFHPSSVDPFCFLFSAFCFCPVNTLPAPIGPDENYAMLGPMDDSAAPASSFPIRRLLGFLLKYWWIPILTLAQIGRA